MKQNISPGVFVGVVVGLVILVGVVGILFWNRSAASGSAAAPGSAAGADPSLTLGALRSHPGETLEQRRARIFAEHGPGRLQGDKER